MMQVLPAHTTDEIADALAAVDQALLDARAVHATALRSRIIAAAAQACDHVEQAEALLAHLTEQDDQRAWYQFTGHIEGVTRCAREARAWVKQYQKLVAAIEKG